MMKTRFATYSIIAAFAFVPATLNAQISVNGINVPTSKKAAKEQLDAKKKEQQDKVDAKKKEAQDKVDAEKKKAQDKIDAAKEKTEGTGTDVSKESIKEAAKDKGVEKANSALEGTGIKITR